MYIYNQGAQGILAILLEGGGKKDVTFVGARGVQGWQEQRHACAPYALVESRMTNW